MVGIDEVGRGAWAGPLLVVAARLKTGKKLPAGLTDSKKLSSDEREVLYRQLIELCDIGEGWVSPRVIDDIGLSNALHSAALLAALHLGIGDHERVVIDGPVNLLKHSSKGQVDTIVQADLLVPVVSAASVIAKVLRDRHMQELATQFKGYGFESHVGYGTRQHSAAIKKYGITHIHRQSFKPIQRIVYTTAI